MTRTPLGSLSFALLLACKPGDAGTTDDGTAGSTAGSTASEPTSGAATTQSTSNPPTSGASTGAETGATGEPGCADADGDNLGVGCAAGEDCNDEAITCTQDCSDIDGNGQPECAEALGTGVLLFTGANGGGPPTDLFVDSLAALYTKAGFVTDITNTFAADFAATNGTLVLLNPLDALPEKVVSGARSLLLRGGRVVLIMEHCKGGCYGNAPGDNDFLAAIGSTIRLSGEGGAPLEETPLTLAAAPPTAGLTTVMAFYSGSVMPGDGLALGTMDGGNGEVVLAYEALYNGDIVVAADSSIFGYMLDKADNSAFVVALAGTLLGGP